MARLRYNGLTATLGADLLTAGTTITFTTALQHAAGAVPTITGTDYIPLSILAGDGTVLEIMHLTAYTSGATTGTVLRAQESTTATDHGSGLRVVHGLTVADTDEFGGMDDSGWQVVGDTGKPAFQNGWVNYGGGEDVAAYRKINGVVYLRGTIKSGTLGSAAFTLPLGYRPSVLPGVTASALYPILSNEAIGKLFVVPSTGEVCPATPASNVYVSLAGVEFPAAT